MTERSTTDTTAPYYSSTLVSLPAHAVALVLKVARDLLPHLEHSITSIAKMLGVSPGTLYNHILDLRELRAGRTGIPAQLEASTR
ncbi:MULTISPECIES: hypothetical protein [unclassified Kitasatospora]|uniref:hypothetical protein n=1 Tax=unclassified Kitasatospora TaxID=2633591 RepID=UPI0038091DBB